MRIRFFQVLIDIIRGRKPFFHDFIFEKFIPNGYIIIPLGTFCLPRAITTFCHLKRRRSHGEKSYPFDLAFFNDVNNNISLIESHFEKFYECLEYDFDKNCYVNNRLNCIFNHDGGLTIEEFKKRYDTRIENFYTDIVKEIKTIYFIMASDKIIEKIQIDYLISVIKKFRKSNFKIILLYCDIKNNIDYNSNLVAVIDNIELNSINENGDWISELFKRNKTQSRRVYSYLNKNLRKIIR